MQKVLPNNAILIPDNAKCVFNGDLFDVYQWPQTMFDGSKKTFEMLRRSDTVQILLFRDKKLLLVKDEQPGRSMHIHMPSGRTDVNDSSWLETAKRELREETGYLCEHWKLISVEQPLNKIEHFVPLYLAWGITEELSQQLDPDGEKIELIWRNFDEVRTSVLSGTETTMSYMVSLFSRTKTIEELLAIPAFTGVDTDR